VAIRQHTHGFTASAGTGLLRIGAFSGTFPAAYDHFAATAADIAAPGQVARAVAAQTFDARALKGQGGHFFDFVLGHFRRNALDDLFQLLPLVGFPFPLVELGIRLGHGVPLRSWSFKGYPSIEVHRIREDSQPRPILQYSLGLVDGAEFMALDG
jgi:hypothetical protein